MSQQSLAIQLSKLKTFTKPKMKLEQYSTDSNIAAELLWDAYMQGAIEDKTVADLGAGTGILGIGALILGAKRVFFVEIDPEAIQTLKENLATLDISPESYTILEADLTSFTQKVDLILMNPPFGTKEEHADIRFLTHAMSLTKHIYTLHKSSTLPFLKQTITKQCWKIAKELTHSFPLKHSMEHHTKSKRLIKVSTLELVK